MAKNFERGQARMFESDFLEFFSKVHPATPIVVYTPVFATALYFAATRFEMGAWAIAWRVVLGYVLWTFTEYWLHRTVFHWVGESAWSKKVHFFLHGVHHDYPWDHTRLVMPLAVSLGYAVVTFGLVYATIGIETGLPLWAGFGTGYIIYDTVHWYTHAGKPKSRLMRYLRRQHMIHHFKEPESRYGVSCPWWDLVFGTLGERHPDSKRGEKSGKTTAVEEAA